MANKVTVVILVIADRNNTVTKLSIWLYFFIMTGQSSDN